MVNCPHKFAGLKRGGFTLVEILCVVVVLEILASLALPNLSEQDDLNVSAAARIVVADLLYAQSQAITSGSPRYVSFTAAGGNTGFGNYSLYDSSTLNTPITQPITLQAYTQKFGSAAASPFTNVALSELALGDPTNTVLVFDSLGTPSICPMTNTAAPTPLTGTAGVTIQCGAMSVTISIEPDTGNIAVSSVQSN